MAIRLTESRLRQIIREEAGKLRRTTGTRRISEAANPASLAPALSQFYPGSEEGVDYDAFVDTIVTSDRMTGAKLKRAAMAGKGPRCLEILKPYLDVVGVESEDLYSVLDAVSRKFGAAELDMYEEEF